MVCCSPGQSVTALSDHSTGRTCLPLANRSARVFSAGTARSLVFRMVTVVTPARRARAAPFTAASPRGRSPFRAAYPLCLKTAKPLDGVYWPGAWVLAQSTSSGLVDSQYTLRLTTCDPRVSVSLAKYVVEMPFGSDGLSTVRTS